ncbi:hypothetical protein BU16DRAFT_160412 [Lophium mytilinum]|uniref:Secreted protein n=1 Tax=Lophium mytilinum TaxID=390894 RepID=A0A6A6QC53_9PEZI|nr:hypothetical protein BU16DRAFT_160412 [Lophium mytilinum]
MFWLGWDFFSFVVLRVWFGRLSLGGVCIELEGFSGVREHISALASAWDGVAFSVDTLLGFELRVAYTTSRFSVREHGMGELLLRRGHCFRCLVAGKGAWYLSSPSNVLRAFLSTSNILSNACLLFYFPSSQLVHLLHLLRLYLSRNTLPTLIRSLHSAAKYQIQRRNQCLGVSETAETQIQTRQRTDSLSMLISNLQRFLYPTLAALGRGVF